MTLPPGFPSKDKYKFTYALYLMFDKDDNLLAMGQTSGPQASLWYHREWINEVVNIRLVWFDDREKCLAALARAALQHKPKYQTVGQLANRTNTKQPICPSCGGP